jgi:hypothetical protein
MAPGAGAVAAGQIPSERRCGTVGKLVEEKADEV